MDRAADSDTFVTQELLAAPASDRCSNCGTPLASDQRYCISCGERRGKARFADAPATEAAPAVPPPPGVRERRPRLSAATTLVTGVATLLLAMGVGVLIGQNEAGNTGRQAAATPQIIKVNVGGGGSGANVASTGSAGPSGFTHRSGGKGSPATTKVRTVHLTKKVTQAVNQAATNVVGSQSKLAPATVQVGGKCQSGQAGCQSGTFTGNFFGGGG